MPESLFIRATLFLLQSTATTIWLLMFYFIYPQNRRCPEGRGLCRGENVTCTCDFVCQIHNVWVMCPVQQRGQIYLEADLTRRVAGMRNVGRIYCPWLWSQFPTNSAVTFVISKLMPGLGRAGRLYPLQPHSVHGDATGHNFDPRTTRAKYDV